MLRPPSNPRPLAPLPEQSADGAGAQGAAPNLRHGALIAERRTVQINFRPSAVERAAWRGEAPVAGVPLSDPLRWAMARTRTWTATAADIERERNR